MDVISVARKIEEKILLLERGRMELQKRAERVAQAIADYDKALSETILVLKHEDELNATLIGQVARGKCWKERLAMELAEREYSNATKGLACIEAEMCGWQSINRYLSTEVTNGNAHY